MDLPSTIINAAYLRGRRFGVTGRLATMTHDQLARFVANQGGQLARSPRRGQYELIVGSEGWGTRWSSADGSDRQVHPETRVLRRARQLQAYGFPVTIVSEDQFLARLGLTDDRLQGLHTIGVLSRILNISPSRIRRWVRLELVRPRATIHRLAFFDFDDVAFMRRLTASLTAGATLSEIRHNLDQLRQWLPAESGRDLRRLAQLDRPGRVMIRLGERLFDAQGQRYFDFDAEHPSRIVAPPSMRLPTSEAEDEQFYFDRGLECEDAGQYEQAAAAYQQAAALAPDEASPRFNLANAFYQLGRLEEAKRHYEATLELAPDYAEAWNNLGLTRAQCGDWAGAIRAFQEAIRLVPSYLDARANLEAVYRNSVRQ